MSVEVNEMKTVSSLSGIDAVVIGAPIYMGRVEADVTKFVKRFSNELKNIPVAAFVVGMAPKNPDPGAADMAIAALKKSLDPVTPKTLVLFAGKLDPDNINFVMRKFLEMAKIPAGDFRDWDAIIAWADELPGNLVFQN